MENIEIKFLDVLGGVFTLLKLGNIDGGMVSWGLDTDYLSTEEKLNKYNK